MKFKSLAALVALAATVHSEIVGYATSGVLSPGIGNKTAQAVSEQAGRHPNATSSITFQRYYNNVPEDWTWRINISDFPVPNNINALGTPNANFSNGFRIVNTQWQLEWPGQDNQTLQGFLKERKQRLRVSSWSWNYPSNITTKYSESDNGTCANVLGANCSQSLMEAASRSQYIDITSLDGCGSTLLVSSGGNNAGVGFAIDPSNSTSNSSDGTSLRREDTLSYHTSPVYDNNTTVFSSAERALQILILAFTETTSQMPSGNGEPSVLCRIVDQTATSVASRWQFPGAALLTAFLICSFFLS